LVHHEPTIRVKKGNGLDTVAPHTPIEVAHSEFHAFLPVRNELLLEGYCTAIDEVVSKHAGGHAAARVGDCISRDGDEAVRSGVWHVDRHDEETATQNGSVRAWCGTHSYLYFLFWIEIGDFRLRQKDQQPMKKIQAGRSLANTFPRPKRGKLCL
jgi:hypothetical protein